MDRRDDRVQANLGLVHSCSRRFVGKGIEYDDLFGAGCIGLVKAVNGFDEGRGVCFSTYAVPVILGEIRRLFRDGGTLKVSRSLKELSMKVIREKERLSRELGREAAVSEIAEKLGCGVEDVAEALSAAMPVVSLTSHGEDGTSEIDIKVPDSSEQLEERIDLYSALDSIEPKDKQLISLRYFDNKTQKETALTLGMTQVQVSRREKAILLKLREKLKQR